MRKRHQAILISSNAKQNIFNEISLNKDTYEIEQKYILNNYFKENINPEDIDPSTHKEKAPENVEEEDEEVENEDLEDSSDREEDFISINSNIKVPHLGEEKGPYIKYEISEKAFVAGIKYDDYIIIPENKIKINTEKIENNNNNNNERRRFYKNYKKSEKKDKNEKNEKVEERILSVGEKIDFNDILEQLAYWAEQLSLENSKNKVNNKRKIKDVEIPDINILQLFKLYPKKMDEILDKIKIMEKEMKDKNINNDNCVMKNILTDQENKIQEKIKNLTELTKELDRIKAITYADNFSLIEFK